MGQLCSSARWAWRAVAAVVCAVGPLTSCGSGAGEPPSERATTTAPIRPSSSAVEREATTSTTERVTTTTTPPSAGVGEDELPFARCTQAEQFGPVTAAISVWDPQTGATRLVAEGLEGVCNGNAELTDTYLTGSGRYLVTLWPNSFGDAMLSLVDLQTGDERLVTEPEVSQWATDQTGTGLGAYEVELELTGFDRSGDGTVYLRDPGSYDQPYYQLPVGRFLASGGSASSLDVLPDWRLCFESSNWSPDGSLCLGNSWTSGTADYYYQATTTRAATEDPNFEAISADAYPDASWLDGNTVLWTVINFGSSLWKESPGDGRQCGGMNGLYACATDLYTVPGDRQLEVWASTTLGKAYVVSRTIDETSDEVFEVDMDPGEPRLVTSMDPGVLPIDR